MQRPDRPAVSDGAFPPLRQVVLAWIAMGLAWAPAVYLFDPANRGAPAFAEAVVEAITGFVPWMAVTPLVWRWCAGADVRRHPARVLAQALAIGVLTLPLLAAAGRMLGMMIVPMLGRSLAGGSMAMWINSITITSLFALPTWFALVAIGLILAESHRAAERERALAAARMEALKSELNPHFLFNTLGGIAELAHRAPDTAERAIASLADIMRATLAEKRDLRPLSEELAAVRDHLDLHGLLIEGVGLELSVDPAAWLVAVPSHILTPLIENATTHGRPDADGRFAVAIAANVVGDSLIVAVANPGPARATASQGLGSGIAHVRARLDAAYGSAAAITTRHENSRYRVMLTLPARPVAPDA